MNEAQHINTSRVVEIEENNNLIWVIERAGYLLKLKEKEIKGLIVMLHKNFVRTMEALEELLKNNNQSILHPVILEGLRKAVNDRLRLIDAQCRDDTVVGITNPKMFLHGAIFVHRLYATNDFLSGFVVQTLAIDVTDEMPVSCLFDIISGQLRIPKALLRLYYERFPIDDEIEEYIPGENLPVAMRPRKFEFDVWKDRLKMLDLFKKTLRNDLKDVGFTDFVLEGQLNLRTLLIGPSTEIFAVPLFYEDKIGAELIQSMTNTFRLKDTRLLPRVPFPSELIEEFKFLQKEAEIIPNYQEFDYQSYETKLPARDHPNIIANEQKCRQNLCQKNKMNEDFKECANRCQHHHHYISDQI